MVTIGGSLVFSLRAKLDVFQTKLTAFLKLLKEDKAYAKFGEYFVKTYGGRVKQWAYAYLSVYGGYNTNMYLESWHAEFKKNYLHRVNQRLDFVLHQLIQFDKDEQEEEIRRKMFGRKRNRRSAKVLKCHKLAAQDWKQLKYNIKCTTANDGQRQFIFENEKAPIIVTQLKCEPLHKCIYTCPECHTCIHHYLCSCENRRVRRDYCIHLCAIGQDKKVLFGFDEQEALEQLEQPDKTGDDDFNCPDDIDCLDDIDCSEDFGGYETDDALETEEIVAQSTINKIVNLLEPAPEKNTKLEEINCLMKEFHAEVIHGANERPDRQDEFLNEIKESFKRFKQIKYSNLNEIANFETEKGRKRAMEKQPRRSPHKKRK